MAWRVFKIVGAIACMGLAAALWMPSPGAAAEALELQPLIQEALKNNRDLLAAETRIAAAGFRITQARGLPDPVVSLGYQNEGFTAYTYGEEQNAHTTLALLLHTDTTRSIGLFRNSSILLERCVEMSIPISAITVIAKGLTLVGVAPALKTSYLSPYRCLRRPSAICERAELWVHKKRTVTLSISRYLF